MGPKIDFRHDGLILDACCVINLYVSGQMEVILRAIPLQVAVAAYVVEEEILRHDLQPYIDAGLLRIVEPDSEEEAIYVINFAAALRGDGEAYTGAIALHRNGAIASDELRVLKFFAREAPQLQRLTTPELLKHWADTTSPDIETVRRALEAIGRGQLYHRRAPCMLSMVAGVFQRDKRRLLTFKENAALLPAPHRSEGVPRFS